MTRVIHADLRLIQTPGGLQAYLGFLLNAPAYYGHNLDALHDILTDVSEPTRLIITFPSSCAPDMSRYLLRLSRVLEDSSRENPFFSWESKDFGPTPR